MEPEIISESLQPLQSTSFISSQPSHTSLKAHTSHLSPKSTQQPQQQHPKQAPINLLDSKLTRPLPDLNYSTMGPAEVRADLYSKISPSGSAGSSRTKKDMMIDDLFHEADLFNEQMTKSHKARTSDESATDSSRSNSLHKSQHQGMPMKRIKNDRLYSDTDMELDPFLQVPNNCAEQVEQFGKYVWKNGWKAMPHHVLPDWLHDNEYLLKGHRPPLPSTKECFKSIFRIHTETGNIWTHLIGALSFMGIAIYFTSRPQVEIQFQEKVVFGAFFFGAITCLACSALFHTFYCYSPGVSIFFNK